MTGVVYPVRFGGFYDIKNKIMRRNKSETEKRKRLLSLLVTLAMVIGLMQGMTLTAYADRQPRPFCANGHHAVQWMDDAWWCDTCNSAVSVVYEQFLETITYQGKLSGFDSKFVHVELENVEKK